MSQVIEGYTPGGGPIAVRYSRDGIEQLSAPARVPDVVVAPGLIDIQINGFGGVDYNGADGGDPAESAARLWARGVTTWYPTIVSADREAVSASIARIAAARRAVPAFGYSVAGLHLEGPYLATADGARGAHDGAVLRDPDIAEFAGWQDTAGGLIRIVTLAPERSGALEFTRRLADLGVLAAMGHSAASAADVHAFVRAGGRLSTHLGNGIPAQIARHDNVLWPQLRLPALSASFIADGHHLPSDAFVAMVRAKGVDRSVLVSDAVSLAGCPPGDYDTAVGGPVTVGPDGRVGLRGTSYLAGSGASLDQCVRWASTVAGLDLADAFAMATANPARLLGLHDRGTLRVGARADLVRYARTADGGIGDVLTTVVDGVVRAGEPG